MYTKIRSLENRRNKSHFNHIVINQDNQDKVITDPEDIVNHLIDRNQRHFGQAEGTPFSIPPLKAYNNLEQLDDPPPGIPEAAKTIYNYLRTTQSLPPINTIITDKDLQRMYTKWNENTTTSPSGLHLGHDKCLRHYDEDQDTQDLAHRVFHIKSKFINMALDNGIIYNRWRQVNTIMIEKVPGNYSINKLRALHIF